MRALRAGSGIERPPLKCFRVANATGGRGKPATCASPPRRRRNAGAISVSAVALGQRLRRNRWDIRDHAHTTVRRFRASAGHRRNRRSNRGGDRAAPPRPGAATALGQSAAGPARPGTRRRGLSTNASRLDHALDRGSEATPLPAAPFKRPIAALRQPIDAPATRRVVAPRAGQETVTLQAMQRRIQRALRQLELRATAPPQSHTIP